MCLHSFINSANETPEIRAIQVTEKLLNDQQKVDTSNQFDLKSSESNKYEK